MALTKVTYSMIEGSPANVLDFGADNTGTSNSSAAIQAAIDSGAEAIYFPSGTYQITSAITLASNQVLFGDGLNSVIEITGGAWNTTYAISGEDTENVVIRNLVFQGNNHSSNVAVLYIENTGAAKLNGPIIDGCTFLDFDSPGVVLIQGPVVDADWVGTAEPSSAWNTFIGTQANNLVFKDCTVPVAFAGTGVIAYSGLRLCSLNNIEVQNCEERSISCGYTTDLSISNCRVNPVSNGSASTNAHGIYVRTTKRYSIDSCQINSSATGSSFMLRLSRGAYYGTISNVNGVCEVAGLAGGFGSIGGDDTVLTGCYFKSPANACRIAGHANATAGVTSASFANANNLLLTGSYFECTGTGLAFDASALAVPIADPEVEMKNVKIQDCTFVNNTSQAEAIAFCAIGNKAIFDGCKFYGDDPQAGVVVQRRSDRVTSGNFVWYFNNCEFISETQTTTANPSAAWGQAFTTVGVLFFDVSSSPEVDITDCYFLNWFTGVGNDVGQIVNISQCTFRDCYSGVRFEGTASSRCYVSRNNFYLPTNNGAAVHFGVANTTATTYSYITHNEMRSVLGRGILFDGVTYQLLYISHNNYDGQSRFIQDCPDVATIKITHNLVTEGPTSSLPANPIDQFNYGIT